ncbi:MAG TPA: LamG domain-containing protein [Verrucomicrobiae bacterium]|jgi:hypothetical protein
MKTTIGRCSGLSLLLCAVTLHWLNFSASAQLTNQVLDLNGTSAYVTVTSSSALQPPDAITVEAWLFPTGTTGWFISKSDGQSGVSQRTYELKWNPSGVDFAVYFSLPVGTNQPDFAEIIAPISTNAWTHVAATYSTNAGLALYTNGGLAAVSTAYSGAPFLGLTMRQTTLPLVFGGVSLAVRSAGYEDEIRIWNTNRSGAEIADDRFCVLTGTESNLVGYWNFDSGTSDDLTTNGNNGTLQGGAAIVPIVGLDVVHDGVCGVQSTPSTATATAVVENGFVVGANITDGGYGYTNTPSVRIIGGDGTGAEAVAVVTNGVVVAVNILDAGSDYTNPPVIVIAPPFIPQPTIAISAMFFGPLVTPVIQLNLANLAPYDNYQLEFSPLVTGPWTNLGALFVPTATTNTQNATGSGNAGFFRAIYVP